MDHSTAQRSAAQLSTARHGTELQHNMQDLNRAAAQMDVQLSGNLLYPISNAHHLRRFILRDYGELQSPDTKNYITLSNSTQDVSHPRTIILTERTPRRMGTSFTVRLTAQTDADFDAWTAALDHVRQHKLPALYAVDTNHVLGHGATSVVFAALRRRDSLSVAVKAISRSAHPIPSIVETYVGRALRQRPCPSLPAILDVFHTRNETHIVMERVSNKTLRSWLRDHKLNEPQARSIFMQVLNAVEFLHGRTVLHGAVASSSVLVAGSSPDHISVKLVGFSAAYMYSRASAKYEPRRTSAQLEALLAQDGLQHVAPELLDNGPVLPAIDFWGLGVLLYEMLVGELPLGGTNATLDSVREFAMIERYDMRQTLLFPLGNQRVAALSPDARSLLSLLLCPSRSQRMNSAGIMRHPWLAFVHRRPKSNSPNSVRRADLFVRE